MNCPVCGNKTSVINTNNHDKWIHRTRECFNCFTKFNTVEIAAEDLIKIQSKVNKLKKDQQGRLLISTSAATDILKDFDILPQIPTQVRRGRGKKNEG